MIDWGRVRGRNFLEECVSGLGYSHEDVEAVQEVMGAVEKEAEFGIDLHDLYRKWAHLEQVENGRTKTLQQYIQVNQQEIIGLLVTYFLHVLVCYIYYVCVCRIC